MKDVFLHRPFEWHPLPSRTLMSYDISFDKVTGQLRLPEDLTQAEADRVCRVVQSVVIPPEERYPLCNVVPGETP